MRWGGCEDGDTNPKPTLPTRFPSWAFMSTFGLQPAPSPTPPHWILLFGYKHLKCLVIDSPLTTRYTSEVPQFFSKIH